MKNSGDVEGPSMKAREGLKFILHSCNICGCIEVIERELLNLEKKTLW